MEEDSANDKLTLIHGENRFEVNKRELANKSRYFASLFFHNFNDSGNKEHVINYDVTVSTLENFIEWIHDDEEPAEINCHFVKRSLTKFLKQNFVGLLSLLQLSVLFIADDLTNDAIDIAILHWLLPEKVIDIWVLAQELGINTLRDICFSVCLDQFNQLPVSSLVELSKSNFVQLIGNINVRSSTEYLRFVRSEWMQHHMVSDIINISEERKSKFLQGMVMHKMDEFFCKDAYIYTWNGTGLRECISLRDAPHLEKGIIGMQVTGRRFSIYTIGGEVGIGTGKFNKVIRRYCLISKKWYYQASLPVPRRHMVAAFLENKLTIVGGVGRHRLKLSTVDILDIHTGEWTRGAKVPECFTEVPLHCVKNGKLFLIKSWVYIYYPEQNYWETILIHSNPAVQKVDAFLTYDATLFLTGNHLSETVLSRVNVTKDSVCKREECLRTCNEHSIVNNATIMYEDESCQLRHAQVADVGIMLLSVPPDPCEHAYLHLHTEMRGDLGNFSCNPRLGYFSVIDCQSLYDSTSG